MEHIENLANAKDKRKPNRFLVVYLFVVILFGALFINLIDLQVVKGNEHLYLSSTIKTSETVIRAPRGLIYDRNGSPLVVNQPSFRLIIDLTEFPEGQEEEIIAKIADIVGLTKESLWEDYRSRAYTDDQRINISQITLLNNVERDNIVSFYSRQDEFPGVYVELGTIRDYPEGELYAHILGYIREVTAQELENSDVYSVGDVIGATGIESYYDEILRGTNGRRRTEMDRDKVEIRELIPVSAEAGDSIQLSLDTEMQRKLTEVLQQGIDRNENDIYAGVAIIQDVSNGQIVAMVSLPTYDNNKIVKGLSSSEYAELSNDSSLPLYNRAVALTQPPGSTFKTVVAAAALSEGTITPDTIYNSTGCSEDLGGGFTICEAGGGAKGELDLRGGIFQSSNIYFCKTAIQLGVGRLNDYTDDFGIGSYTGIDLPDEQPGIEASPEMKDQLEGEPWYDGDSCITGIGQGLTRVSPIQMVSWISAIANGGTYYKPHITKAILGEDGNIAEEFESEIIHELPVSDYNLAVIREGMHLAVTNPKGSAYSALNGFPSDPAAKTGSAETLRKVDGVFEEASHSWVTGFFPYNNPRYSFVVYLEYGGWGYESAGVMRDFLMWYESEYEE